MCDLQPRGSGLEISATAKKLGSQMVMVEASVHSEFPATVPCLSPLDYFLVQGLPHFKASSLPMSVIRSCYRGLYFSTETHGNAEGKLKVTISHTQVSVFHLRCGEGDLV